MSVDKFATDNGIDAAEICDRLRRRDEVSFVQGFRKKKAFAWRFRIPWRFRMQIYNKVPQKTEVEQVVMESENEPLHAEANTHTEVDGPSPATSNGSPCTPSSSFKETPSPPDSIDRALQLYPPDRPEEYRLHWAQQRYAMLRDGSASHTVSAGNSEESCEPAPIRDPPFKTVDLSAYPISSVTEETVAEVTAAFNEWWRISRNGGASQRSVEGAFKHALGGRIPTGKWFEFCPWPEDSADTKHTLRPQHLTWHSGADHEHLYEFCEHFGLKYEEAITLLALKDERSWIPPLEDLKESDKALSFATYGEPARKGNKLHTRFSIRFTLERPLIDPMVDVILPWFGKVKNNPSIDTSSATQQGKGEQVDGAKRDNVDGQPRKGNKDEGPEGKGSAHDSTAASLKSKLKRLVTYKTVDGRVVAMVEPNPKTNKTLSAVLETKGLGLETANNNEGGNNKDPLTLSQDHVPKRIDTTVVKAAMKKTEEAAAKTQQVDEVS